MSAEEAKKVLLFGTTVLVSMVAGAVIAASVGLLSDNGLAIFGGGILGFAVVFASFSFAIHKSGAVNEVVENGGESA